MSRSKSSSVAPEDVARFSAQAGDWWNPEGPFRSLHRLGPLRTGYVRNQISAHGNRKKVIPESLKGLQILDVGCGGGLMAEPMAALGAEVTGLDASFEMLAVARDHARASGLKINYQEGSVEALAEEKTRFDVITALEIVEHVANREIFFAALAKLLKPGGLLILSTLNRTTHSFLLGVVVAEYVLGWVPRGTHEWEKFVRPSELVHALEKNGLTTTDLTGMVFNPLTRNFELRKSNLRVNYLLTARKK